MLTWTQRYSQADQHVREGRSTIQRQRALIDRQRALGRDTMESKKLLATLEQSQMVLERDLERIRNEPE